jgi:hypothetical protein
MYATSTHSYHLISPQLFSEIDDAIAASQWLTDLKVHIPSDVEC